MELSPLSLDVKHNAGESELEPHTNSHWNLHEHLVKVVEEPLLIRLRDKGISGRQETRKSEWLAR